MWEVFTCGKMPYGRLKNTEVVERVQRGIILERPKACFKEVYEVCHSHILTDEIIFQIILRIDTTSTTGLSTCIINRLFIYLGNAKMLGSLPGSTTIFPCTEGAANQRVSRSAQ